MIYKGSQKEGKVYKGSTKIGKVYKGSQLVYQNAKGLNLYAYKANDSKQLIVNIGNIGNNYPYVNFFSWDSTTYESIPFNKITNIQGTLGQSNSKVTISLEAGGTWTGDYKNIINLNGINVYLYSLRLDSWIVDYCWIYVIEASIADGYALMDTMHINDGSGGFLYPSSADQSQIVTTAGTLPRYSQADVFWTGK